MAMSSIFSNVTASAERITRLTWFMIVLAAIVYIVVIALMIVAMRRNRHAPRDAVNLSDVPSQAPSAAPAAQFACMAHACNAQVAEIMDDMLVFQSDTRNTMSARLKMSSGNGSISGRRHRGGLHELIDDRGDLIRPLQHQQVAAIG